MSSKEISIVIPAFNEERNVARCIKSVWSNGFPVGRVEIVLVDNGSTDRTRDIAAELGAEVVIVPSGTISTLRNTGAKHSKGRIIGFLDADCTMEPGWMKKALEVLTKREIGITGSRLMVPESGNWVERAWAFHLNSKSNKYPTYINSGNCVLRKEVFAAIGGFSESLMTSEDVDLCERIISSGYLVYECKKIAAVHWGYPKSVKEFLKREIWHGIGDASRNLSRFRVSKPILISLWPICVLIVTVLMAVTMRDSGMLYLLLLNVLPSFALSFVASAKGKTYRYLVPLIFLFLVYTLGRTISLIIAVKIIVQRGFTPRNLRGRCY